MTNPIGKALVDGGMSALRRLRRLQYLALDWQSLGEPARANIRRLAPELAQQLDENLADQNGR